MCVCYDGVCVRGGGGGGDQIRHPVCCGGPGSNLQRHRAHQVAAERAWGVGRSHDAGELCVWERG